MSMIEMSAGEQMRMLSTAYLLEPLSEEELEKFAKRCPDICYRQGKVISTPHDPGSEAFYIVKKGRVRVYELSPEGREHTLAEITGGTAFAAKRLSDVYAQTIEETILVILGREDVKQLIKSNPEVGMRFIEVLVERLNRSERRLADIALQQVPARLANLILDLVEDEGIVTKEGYRLPIRYTHDRLGAMIGAQRVAVTRAFGDLRKLGAIETEQRKIHVKDIEALKRLVGRR
jgi:CRP/FNR family transcriptional regulator, cyclic AMP receptor protein